MTYTINYHYAYPSQNKRFLLFPVIKFAKILKIWES